jgi:uracil phosphoribosyltransferase
VPTARVGFVGMYRDKKTKLPVAYYERIPEASGNALYIVIDPMIATGGSTAATIDILKQHGARHIVVVCIVTCPEGLEAIESVHPDVRIYTAAIDYHLNERKYIVPGLGDAGDRLFGTS